MLYFSASPLLVATASGLISHPVTCHPKVLANIEITPVPQPISNSFFPSPELKFISVLANKFVSSLGG